MNQQNLKNVFWWFSRGLWFVAGLFSVVALIALIKDTIDQGQDFVVFWRAARAIFSGQNAYDLNRDGAMVFKYPPWILPVFFPFAAMPLIVAKWVWGILEAAALVFVTWWVRGRCSRDSVVFLVVVCFFGIWAVHALDGQVMLPILALVLWARGTRSAARWGALIWGLSIKIFTGIAIFGTHLREWSVQRVACLFAIFSFLSVPAGLVLEEKNPIALIHVWLRAAASGEALLSSTKVWGRENQGFPALIERWFSDVSNSAVGSVFFVGVTVFVLVFLWYRASRKLTEEEGWVGWLAVSAILHPLAWFHHFVLVFPVAAFAVDRAIQQKKVKYILLSVLGVLLVAATTRKTLGTFGAQLELLSIKSWGTLLCLFVLSRTGNQKAKVVFPA